jgi:hypothetical protein
MILFQYNNVVILSLIIFYLNYNQHAIYTNYFKILQYQIINYFLLLITLYSHLTFWTWTLKTGETSAKWSHHETAQEQNGPTGTKRLGASSLLEETAERLPCTVQYEGGGEVVETDGVQQDGRWQQLTWRPTVSLPEGCKEGERAVGSHHQPRIHGAINSHLPPGLHFPAEIQALYSDHRVPLSLMAMASLSR